MEKHTTKKSPRVMTNHHSTRIGTNPAINPEFINYDKRDSPTEIE